MQILPSTSAPLLDSTPSSSSSSSAPSSSVALPEVFSDAFHSPASIRTLHLTRLSHPSDGHALSLSSSLHHASSAASLEATLTSPPPAPSRRLQPLKLHAQNRVHHQRASLLPPFLARLSTPAFNQSITTLFGSWSNGSVFTPSDKIVSNPPPALAAPPDGIPSQQSKHFEQTFLLPCLLTRYQLTSLPDPFSQFTLAPDEHRAVSDMLRSEVMHPQPKACLLQPHRDVQAVSPRITQH